MTPATKTLFIVDRAKTLKRYMAKALFLRKRARSDI